MDDADDPYGHGLTSREIGSILAGTILAMFLAALDQTIVAPALPTIGAELKDLEHLSWVVTAYLLTATAVTPLYGKASDIYGRRIAMLVGVGVFILGSIACALAPTLPLLAAARALQGLGGGGLISLGQTIIADLIPPRERARYQAYFASMFVLSSVLGPVLGGFFAQKLHWSWIFWINVPLGLLAFAMTFSLLKKLPRHDRRRRLDIAGALLMTAATTTLMLALSWGGVRYPWSSATIIGLFGLSAMLWLAFVLRLRTAREPLIPTEIFANRVVTRATIAACFGMGVFIGLTIYMPIFLEAAYGLSASQTGLALLPLMLGTVAGATTSGRVMLYVERYKRLPLAGLAISVAATAILAWNAGGLPFWAVEILFALTSFGLGTILPVTTVAIQNAVLPHQMGTATGSMNFFRQLGGALVVSVFGAMLLAGLNAAPGVGITHELLAELARSGTGVTETFRAIFAAASAGLAIAALALAAMEERPLRGRAIKAAETAIAPE